MEKSTVQLLEALEEALARLKKNREQINPRLLETKYAKGYNRLKNQIVDLTNGFLRQFILEDHPIAPKDALVLKRLETGWMEMLTEIRERHLDKVLLDAVFNRYDTDFLCDTAVVLRQKFDQRYYLDYWFGTVRQSKEGGYCSLLVNRKFAVARQGPHDYVGFWTLMNPKTEAEESDIAFYWPPTRELYEQLWEPDVIEARQHFDDVVRQYIANSKAN